MAPDGAAAHVATTTTTRPRAAVALAVVQLVTTFAAACTTTFSAVLGVVAGLFGSVQTAATGTFAVAAIGYGACTVLAGSRSWRWATWLSPAALLSTVAAAAMTVGDHVAYRGGIAAVVVSAVVASGAVVVRCVGVSRNGCRDWSHLAVALGLVAAATLLIVKPHTAAPTDGSGPGARIRHGLPGRSRGRLA